MDTTLARPETEGNGATVKREVPQWIVVGIRRYAFDPAAAHALAMQGYWLVRSGRYLIAQYADIQEGNA